MKKKILAISAVLLFVMSSVAIGGDRDYDVFIHKGYDAYSNRGFKSLDQGIQTWIDKIKEKRQKEGMQAIAKMLQHDDISMAELFQVIIDHDLDPQTTMQVLKPFLATKKVH
jgi:glucokinase